MAFPAGSCWWSFTLGTFLMRSAGCCVNDVADREFDLHVKRTAQRPVTRGAVSVKEALTLGAVLALAAFGLVLDDQRGRDCLVVRGAGHHAGLSLCQALRVRCRRRCWASRSASASRWPLPRSVQSRVPVLAWVLLLGNLFWVLAYDTEYAMVDRDDDLRIGMKTSAITFGRADVAVVMLCYAGYLAIWTRRRWPAGLRRWRSCFDGRCGRRRPSGTTS